MLICHSGAVQLRWQGALLHGHLRHQQVCHMNLGRLSDNFRPIYSMV